MKQRAPTILVLADRRQNRTSKELRAAGYRLTLTFTPDHAVALCAGNLIDFAVLDQAHFIVTEGWSVAQSLKLVKPHICVVLIVRGKMLGESLPPGIDAVVPEGDVQALLRALHELA